MKYGIYVPNCWSYGTVGGLTRLALEAEEAGWDGFFIWDHLLIAEDIPLVDSQVAMASIAAATSAEGLKSIGSLVTPLARRRPWKVARETAALQELAEGRLVVGIGLGQPPEYVFSNQELPTPPERGVALDDAVELLVGFWSGQPVTWRRPAERCGDGESVPQVDAPPFLPAPEPVPPIWVAGAVYREPAQKEPDVVAMSKDEYKPQLVDRTVDQPTRPFRRAARHQGLFPITMPWDNSRPITPAELRLAVDMAFPDDAPPDGYDVIAYGRTAGPDAPTSLGDLDLFQETGATWWLESPPDLASLEDASAIIAAGPPTR
ncbi:LLM class flavin-dependent oxidoreductase [Phytoactinopolyspora alkaliphila]|uniref:LLM class flavin-dependent oxidoreductase n=1 Tax=Phytoactinopolyspora alkaliphila TaxID=1783498 RepID=A0A6N9YRL0_9ACTN|nr:LLM class flavin-dependent oxidoreductase [Phytoactinopolyspora alkaliphila]NED97439.1 LLM class flavin-dependent oxidoreductase [Phytoactinopolyspora alkaliphila]